MAVNIRPTSRMRFARLTTIEEVECWEQPEYPEVPTADDDGLYVVEDGDEIDDLAQRFYADSALWWVLALANDLRLLPTELNVGMELRVPSLNRVQTRLLRSTQRTTKRGL